MKGSPSLHTSPYGSAKRPGLPQLRDTYPMSLPGSPLSSTSEGNESMQQRLSLEPKASYMRIHPRKINVLLGLPAPDLQPKLQPATPARNTTAVWFVSHLRKAPEQETCFRDTAAGQRQYPARRGAAVPPELGLGRRADPKTAVEAQ